MPIIYLKHPVHGNKVAISDQEAEMDKSNGWEEFDPTAPKAAPAPSQPEPDAPTINALPARRGRSRPKAESQEE
jgi:hypothetical protein